MANTPDNHSEPAPVGDWHEPDGALQGIVSIFNTVGRDEGSLVTIGITIWVGGTRVIGDLMNGRAWWKENAESLRGGAEEQDEAGRAMLIALAEFFARIEGEYGEAGALSTTTYLHLRDARVFGQGQNPDHQYLRLRLSEVQGWSLGR